MAGRDALGEDAAAVEDLHQRRAFGHDPRIPDRGRESGFTLEVAACHGSGGGQADRRDDGAGERSKLSLHRLTP